MGACNADKHLVAGLIKLLMMLQVAHHVAKGAFATINLASVNSKTSGKQDLQQDLQGPSKLTLNNAVH